ncbi:hypothetical protein BO78DRAFT_439955 [Aspergillus sclerotiicarbonarius CBS 121057]|uniref:Uncharacterized protein n=1 Tax=Aspergillus sclerotiicarbonarius (strain CBS 121057 / IBT 28362) TaxID=1448318 RepID=A0A319EWG7_ASPSB|nr:hypothetical protein BO78DRAFT_439955 [Aspergillus sclerotiicarbonarius CBS 121057]
MHNSIVHPSRILRSPFRSETRDIHAYHPSTHPPTHHPKVVVYSSAIHCNARSVYLAYLVMYQTGRKDKDKDKDIRGKERERERERGRGRGRGMTHAAGYNYIMTMTMTITMTTSLDFPTG